MSVSYRLLTVSNYFDTHLGGLEIVAGRLAHELAARGYSVTWMASDAAPAAAGCERLQCVALKAWNGTERRLGVPWPVLSPGSVVRLWRAAANADAVLVHDGLYLSSLVAAAAARLARRPLLVVLHIGEIRYRSPLLRNLMRLGNRLVAAPILTSADQVVFISDVVRQHFARVRLRRPAELIFNGVDGAVFRPADYRRRAAARTKFGLTHERPIALFVGRFVEKKGLAALRRLAEVRPDLAFALAGWGPEDPDGWGLSNVRVFRGLAGAELAELYRAANVFVLPSRGEGFPLVVQEAMASGLPVVCGAESARADPLAADLLHGVDVEDDNPDEVARRLSAATDAAIAVASGGASRRAEFARSRYGWSAAADRYADLLQALIEGRSPSPARQVLDEEPLEAA